MTSASFTPAKRAPVRLTTKRPSGAARVAVTAAGFQSTVKQARPSTGSVCKEASGVATNLRGTPQYRCLAKGYPGSVTLCRCHVSLLGQSTDSPSNQACTASCQSAGKARGVGLSPGATRRKSRIASAKLSATTTQRCLRSRRPVCSVKATPARLG